MRRLFLSYLDWSVGYGGQKRNFIVVGFGKEVGIGTAVVIVGRAYAFDDVEATTAQDFSNVGGAGLAL